MDIRTIVLVRKSDQMQLNLSNEDAQALLKMAGAASDIHMGNPRNGKPSLRVTLRFKSREFVWIQGDTHAFWKSHQQGEGEGRLIFDALIAKLKKGEAVSVEVLDAKLQPGAGANVRKLDDLKLDLD